ncbi:MAG: FTR1 family protein [Ilumatobacteraceae bacterium]|nr:FTR1 family protein [Ilumatobacteraceae bacterium]
MSASFLITLREGLEISLVLAILFGYLSKTNRASDFRHVWIGSGIAVLVCLVLGIVINSAVGGLNGKVEQAVEGVLALAACAVLSWMVFWMRGHARGIGTELRQKIDHATTTSALSVIAFVAVTREGLETVLFLLGSRSATTTTSQFVIGGLLGLVIAAILGYLVYVGGNRFNLRMFFNVTGILLIFFAAGLAGKAVHELRELFGFEGGWLFSSLWDLQSGPLANGNIYDFLKGLLGWHNSPERIRVITYVVYASTVLTLYLRNSSSTTGVTKPATPVVSVK